MPKQRTFIQSDEAIEQQRAYARRKSAARSYIWSRIKSDHKDLFDVLIKDFNDTQGEKFTKRGEI